ncbi:hypothetical protein [Lactiplantibacillus plantarum]|uniref:hypothetical protein n=1 Tax=Lactiplantibacillus plantarum TaxID=1590 RepID=UPI0007E46DFF|nr:hypothetical protein [Lactiplantibacillus plantarum]ANI95918.1 hypothetical protein A9F05_10245 [Lactiplantibacillus plantarum]AYG27396.1 hypothetical protein CFI62_05135 [Lactiplantibacillus plantarum]
MKRWNRLLQRIQVKYSSLSEQQLLKINYWLLAIYLVLCGVAYIRRRHSHSAMLQVVPELIITLLAFGLLRIIRWRKTTPKSRFKFATEDYSPEEQLVFVMIVFLENFPIPVVMEVIGNILFILIRDCLKTKNSGII